MIDCGTGAVGALQRADALLDVDAVLLSHLHADHCLDLVAWYYTRYYHPDGPRPTVPVYGPQGSAERIAKAFDDVPMGLSSTYDWRLAKAGHMEIGPFDIELAAMRHPIESLGMRIIADGKTFAYSSDTAECEALPAIARDADFLLSEASWQHDCPHPDGVHMSGIEAAQMANRAGAGRLLLTHVVPWCSRDAILAEALTVRPEGTEMARPGGSYEI